MATPASSRTPADLGVGPNDDYEETKGSAWGGWLVFASAMFVVLGIFNVLNGIAALVRHQVFVTTPNAQVVFNMTAWGWILIVFGVLQLLAGYFVQTGVLWARSIAVVLCGLNAIAQLAFLPHYPVWSTLVIALDVITIWAVTVHGKEGRRDIW